MRERSLKDIAVQVLSDFPGLTYEHVNYWPSGWLVDKSRDIVTLYFRDTQDTWHKVERYVNSGYEVEGVLRQAIQEWLTHDASKG